MWRPNVTVQPSDFNQWRGCVFMRTFSHIQLFRAIHQRSLEAASATPIHLSFQCIRGSSDDVNTFSTRCEFQEAYVQLVYGSCYLEFITQLYYGYGRKAWMAHKNMWRWAILYYLDRQKTIATEDAVWYVHIWIGCITFPQGNLFCQKIYRPMYPENVVELKWTRWPRVTNIWVIPTKHLSGWQNLGVLY